MASFQSILYTGMILIFLITPFPYLKSFNSFPQLSRTKFKFFHLVYKAFCDLISFYITSFIVCHSFIFTLCSSHTEQFVVLCSFLENQTTFQDHSLPGWLWCTMPVPLTLSIPIHLLRTYCTVCGLWFSGSQGDLHVSQTWIPNIDRCLLDKWIKEKIPRGALQIFMGHNFELVFFLQKWSWFMLTCLFSFYWFPWSEVLYVYVGWCWWWWGTVCACVCCVCLWKGKLKEKRTFLETPSKTQLSKTVENKSPGLPVPECPDGLGLKSFRVLHSSFSMHIFLASHQINMRFSLTSKSNQPNLLFTEITLRDLTWTN